MAYNFQSVGASAGNAIEELLVRRQAEARQRMLDEITQQNAAAQNEDRVMNRKIQQANLDSLDTQRDVMNEERLTGTAAKVAGMLSPNQPLDAGTSGILREGKLGALINPGQEAGVLPPEMGEGPQQELPETFRGTPTQIKTREDRARLEQYLGTLDPNSNEAKALNYELQTGKAAPAGMFNEGTSPIIRVNPQTGKVETIGEAPKGAHFVAEPPPKPPVDTTELEGAGLDMAAKMYAKTGQLPALGMAAGPVRTRILNRASQYDTSTDTFTATAPPDIAGNKADFAANTASQTSLQRNLDAATAFSDTAHKNSAQLEAVLKTIPETGLPFLNRPLRAAATALGDTTMASFNGIRQSVSNEYARIISNPNLVGVLSDNARQEMEKILNPDATGAQILAAMRQLQIEADNRVESYSDQISHIKGRPPRGNGGAMVPVTSHTSTAPGAAPARRKFNPATGQLE